jgi:hypothetical protein
MFHRLFVTELMNHFALLSFAIFFLIFVATAVWAFCLPRERVRRIEQLPLEPDQSDEH